MSEASSSSRSSRRNSASTVVKGLIGWLLLWLAASFLVGMVVSAIYGVQDKQPPLQAYYAASAVTSSCVFLYATWRRVGWDPVRLGIVPLQLRWLLALLSTATLLQLPAVGLLIRALSPPRSAHFVYAETVRTGVAWIKVPLIIVSVAMAPLVEEVLFRGWLWTDLRRYWSASSVAIFTGLVFLLIHVADDYRNAYGLVIFIVIVTLARHYCSSVKATIWLHL